MKRSYRETRPDGSPAPGAPRERNPRRVQPSEDAIQEPLAQSERRMQLNCVMFRRSLLSLQGTVMMALDELVELQRSFNDIFGGYDVQSRPAFAQQRSEYYNSCHTGDADNPTLSRDTPYPTTDSEDDNSRNYSEFNQQSTEREFDDQRTTQQSSTTRGGPTACGSQSFVAVSDVRQLVDTEATPQAQSIVVIPEHGLEQHAQDDATVKQGDTPVPADDVQMTQMVNFNVAQVLQMFQKGVGGIPPVSQWSEDECETRQSLLSSWNELFEYFQHDFHGNAVEFVCRFTGPTGQLLTVEEVLQVKRESTASSHDNPPEDAPVEISESVSEHVMPRSPDMTSAEATEPVVDYFLPRRIRGRQVNALDAIDIWQRGYLDIPPIESWLPSQRVKQQGKLTRWKKIVAIFTTECKSSKEEFIRRYSKPDGQLLSISGIIDQHEYSTDRPSTTISLPLGSPTCKRPVPILPYSMSHGKNKVPIVPLPRGSTFMIQTTPSGVVTSSQHLPFQFVSNASSPPTMIGLSYVDAKPAGGAPLLATAAHVSAFHPPPLWSHEQRVSEVEQRVTPRVLLATSDASAVATNGIAPNANKKTVSCFCLPPSVRNTVSIMDIVHFWEQGSPDFPAIKKWRPCDMVAYEDTFVVWRRVVEIFHGVFDSDFDRLATVCIENSGCNLNVNSFLLLYGGHLKSKAAVNTTIVAKTSLAGGTVHAVVSENGGSTLGVSEGIAPPYILPRKLNGVKVSPLDVIKFWYQGWDGMLPISKWTVQQRSKQQSKVSRWRRFIEIFETTCGGDAMKLHEMFSDGNGKLLPVMSIIAKADSRVCL